MVSSTEGVIAASEMFEGLIVALAKPLPHHRAAVSIAASAPTITSAGRTCK